MKLTKEMYDLAVKNSKICTIYNDEYVLLYKTLPVTDDKIGEYLNSLKQAQEFGINTPIIEDYKLCTSSGGEYTKGVFLEKKARGNNINEGLNTYIHLSSKEELSEEFIDLYLKQVDLYIRRLKERADAPIEMYEKLISDCINLEKFDLEIDPKPLNFFFNKESGFEIIDVISSNRPLSRRYLPRYIFIILYGYNEPKLNLTSALPEEYLLKYEECIIEINKKIVDALKKFDIADEYIKEAMNTRTKLKDKYKVVSRENLREYYLLQIGDKLPDVKKEESKEKRNDRDVSMWY